MEEKVNLKKASTSYFIGTMFNKGIAFLTVPIFTRLLSTSDYGIVNTYNSWIAILATIIGFALHAGIRIAFVDYKKEMNDFLATVTTFTIISGVVLSSVTILISRCFVSGINSALIALCLFHSTSSALIEDYSMYLMMQYKYKFRTVLMVLPNVLSVGISIFVIKKCLNDQLYLGRIIPTSVIMMTFGVIVSILVYTKSKCLFNKEYIKYAITLSAPLIIHGIALNILSQSDRTMITLLADSSQTGIYSLIYNFSMIAMVITTSIEGIWVPWFYKKLKNREIKEINLVAKDYIHFMTYSLIGVIMVGPEVVKLLTVKRYWDGISIIPPIVFSNFIIFAYTLYVNIEHYHKKTSGITVNTVIAAMTNLILNSLLIPKYGYIAAAYTTLFSYVVSLFLHAYKSKKLEPDLYPLDFFIEPVLEISIGIILFYCFVDSLFIRWGIVFAYEVVMLVKEKNRIIVYFPKLKRNKGEDNEN